MLKRKTFPEQGLLNIELLRIHENCSVRNLLKQSPPDQPGRHSAQYCPFTKKSSLGRHVPLLQRLQFSNMLHPEEEKGKHLELERGIKY